MKVQTFTHSGSGNINVDCIVNNYYQDNGLINDKIAIALQELLVNIQNSIPASFSKNDKDDTVTSLKEIEYAVAENDCENSKGKIRRALRCLKSFATHTAATASFAAAVTDLITFFSQ